MISDREAIAQAQELYRRACDRFKKLPRDTVGEVMFSDGLRLAALFDGNGKLVAVYRVGDDRVIDLDGAELVKLRAKLSNRKVR
jgi:hypothetical protein